MTDGPRRSPATTGSRFPQCLTTEFAKYLVVGGLNALFTFLVFVASLYWVRMHYLVALIAAWGCGFVLTYVLNHAWVFKPEDRVRFRGRFAKYLASNIATLALNLVLLYGLVNGTGMEPFYGQVVVMGLIVAINFSAAKWWSLAPSRAVGARGDTAPES